MAEDSSSNTFRSVPISDQSDNRPSSAFGRVYFLRIPRNALSGWLRDALTRDVPGFLHILSLIAKRDQRINTHCDSVHVRVLGTKE